MIIEVKLHRALSGLEKNEPIWSVSVSLGPSAPSVVGFCLNGPAGSCSRLTALVKPGDQNHWCDFPPWLLKMVSASKGACVHPCARMRAWAERTSCVQATRHSMSCLVRPCESGMRSVSCSSAWMWQRTCVECVSVSLFFNKGVFSVSCQVPDRPSDPQPEERTTSTIRGVTHLFPSDPLLHIFLFFFGEIAGLNNDKTNCFSFL